LDREALEEQEGKGQRMLTLVRSCCQSV